MKFEGAQYPAWMQGRTAEEIAGLASNMADALRLNQAPAPQPPPQAPANGLPTDQTWMTNPNDAAASVFRSTFAPQISAYVQQQAGIIRGLAEQKYNDEFKRWGPEIDSVLARVPVENRTLDIVEHAVKLVRGNHVDEIADERAKAKMAQLGALGERADGSGASGPGVSSGAVDLSKLPEHIGTVAKQHGLTVQQVIDSSKAMGITPQRWMEMAQDQKVISSVNPFSFEMNQQAEGMGGQRQFS